MAPATNYGVVTGQVDVAASHTINNFIWHDAAGTLPCSGTNGCNSTTNAQAYDDVNFNLQSTFENEFPSTYFWTFDNGIYPTAKIVGRIQPDSMLGFSVTGLDPGERFEITDGSGQTLYVNSDSTLIYFPKTYQSGEPYNFSVLTQPSGGETCTITNGSGSFAGSDIRTVEFVCN